MTGTLNIQSASDETELIVKGKAGQTADLLQVKNSSDTVLASIASSGRGIFNGIVSSVGNDIYAAHAISTNTRYGLGAFRAAATGGNNIAIGSALNNITSGHENIAMGNGSGLGTLAGSSNIAIGHGTLNTNGGGAGGGNNNTVVGTWALTNAGSVSNNTAIGASSLAFASGASNIGIGFYSGRYNTSQLNELFINSIDRTDRAGDISKSIIYGVQHATPSATNQTLTLNAGTSVTWGLTVNPGAAANIPLLVKGAASQTANLQEWQNSSSGVLASVTKDGYINAVTPPAADQTTKAATTAWATERATVGNLLTANQASGGDTLGTTVGLTGINGAQAIVNGGVLGRCVEVTASGAASRIDLYGNGSAYSGTMLVGIIAGQVYTFAFSLKSAVSGLQNTVNINWFNDSNTIIGSTIVRGATQFSAAWTPEVYTTVAPSGATQVALRIYSGNSVAGDKWYADCFGFWAGAGGEWAMPGTPITNLSVKVSRPNVDDYLCQTWSNTENKWVTTRYDSGWRAFTPTGSGWSATIARIRRTGDRVTVRIEGGVMGAANPIDTAILSTVGFRPAMIAVGGGRNTSSGVYAGLVAATSNLSWNSTVTNGNTFYCDVSYVTDDAIPTSLPGTLVSAAPA